MEFQKTTVFALHVFILSAAITLNTAAARGQTRTDKTYRCTAKDAISLQGNGTIGKNDPAADARRKHFESMTVDVLSGAISYGGAGIRERRVVQELDADDHILIPRTSFIQRKEKRRNRRYRFHSRALVAASHLCRIFTCGRRHRHM